MKHFAIAIGLALLSFRSPPASAAEWNQWGGANRDFVDPEPAVLTAWQDFGPFVLWERELGAGYSGIVTEGERLFTMTRRGENEIVVALDQDTGATLWEFSYPAPVGSSHDLDTTWGAGPNSTPLVFEGRLYTLGFTGKLHCLEAASGRLLWSHDLAQSVDDAVPYFGLSTSPLSYGGLLIVIAGGAYAFDLENGESKWANHEFNGSYASPLLLERGGRAQVIAPVAGEVVSLDPESGRLLWRHEHANEHRTFLSGVVTGEDQLLFASAYFLGSVGLELAADGSGVTELWQTNRLQLSYTNSVRDGNLIYGFHNSILSALDVTTGEILWRHRGFERANLIRSGDHFLLFDRYGNLSLVSLNRYGSTTHAEAQILEGRSWTVPTLIGSRLYARNLERIVALDLSRSQEAQPIRTTTASVRSQTPGSTQRRSAIEAPEEFLAAKRRLMSAYFRSDAAGLTLARAEFARWVADDALGYLAHYYIGFAAFRQVLMEHDGPAVALLRESEKHLSSAVAVNPSFAEAHALLARIYPTYYRLDPQRGAVVGPLGDEHLATARRLEPDNPRVIAIQGLDFFYSPPQYGGDQVRGMNLLRRALEVLAEVPDPAETRPKAEPDWGPAIIRAWYGRALLSRGTTNRVRAIEILRAALEVEPDFASARRMLARAQQAGLVD